MSVHILAECPEKIPSVELGILKSLQPLCDQEKCQVLFKRTVDVKKTDIAWADIVVSVRGCESYSCSIIRAAKKAGRLCLYFLDDDLLHIPEESGSYSYFQDPLIQQNMKTILSLSDALWGTNDRIRNIYGPLCGGDGWILARMPVTLEDASDTDASDCVNVLYAGSVDHQAIVRELLAPAADRLSLEYGGKVSFTFIGPDPKLPKRDNLHYKKYFSNYDEYKAFVKAGRFHIGLAPTRTSDFFRAKYYNKFVEYTAIGAAGVYTNSEPYTQIVRDGVNGLLCDNTADSWCQCIRRFIDDAGLRKNCVKNARAVLEDQYNPDAVAQFLAAQFPAFVTYHAPAVPPGWIRLPNPWVSVYLGRTALCWRQYGILSVPVILFKAIKRIGKTVYKGFCKIVHRLF